MRNRIDITEVEAGTKIRAKYLRALENEEWDLLPGPTFVKTFLRTYADYLGLDSRLLVEEYKQRFERPSTMELTPFAPRGRRPRRERRRRARGARPGARGRGRLVAAARRALRARARWGDDDNAARAPNTRRAARDARRPRRDEQEAQRSRRRRTRVTLQIVPTGTVNVCLVDASGRALINSGPAAGPADAGATAASASASPFGNGQARHAVGGPTIDVPDRSTPVGYECGPGKRPRELSAAQRPTCP